MYAEELVVGMQVRYPRTGTTGRITKIEQLKGALFAEIDTTHLLYRADQLIPAPTGKEKAKREQEEDIERIKKEREFLTGSGFQEAVTHSDQSCEGGG